MVESISPLFSPAWEASNKAQPTSMDFALRYPEPTAQPTARNMQRAAPPPHPSAETYSLPNSAQAYPSSTSLNSLSVSGTRSVSPGERRGSCMSSRQNRGHADPAVRYSIERPSSHTPQRCYGSRNSSFVDPEKASYAPNSVSSGFHSHHAHSICLSEDEEDVKDHTVWILIYLSFLSPMIATFVSVYTILTTSALLLLSPLSLCCRTCQPLRHQFQKFLIPPIDLQLGLIFSSHGSDSKSLGKPEEQKCVDSNVILLIMINILSPAYAAGIAVTSLVAAGFWFTALILGNPDGRDGRDDGRAVVLGVKNLWEKWLKRGLR